VAYRFLLEVPESLVDEANIVVGSTGDAEIVVVRNSHGLGFEDLHSDLTIAAHTLRVIGAIYDWADSGRVARGDLHLALHSGQRLSLADFDRGAMVAAIRRDQPWVEHTIPKIGDHARDVLPTDPSQSDLKPRQPVAGAAARTSRAPLVTAPRSINYLSPARVSVRVTELDRAERYYIDFLGAHLLGRERYDDRGDLQPVESDFNHARALATGTEAAFSYLASGPLEIRLERVGRGARLPRGGDEPIMVAVDRPGFLQLKGDALMRGMEFVRDQPDSFAVRDIYGLIWQFQATADTPALVR
jgi:catechol 2,3-dioxygenase-like lactoylglutathione lyase family enzyme